MENLDHIYTQIVISGFRSASFVFPMFMFLSSQQTLTIVMMPMSYVRTVLRS